MAAFRASVRSDKEPRMNGMSAAGIQAVIVYCSDMPEQSGSLCLIQSDC